jgi:hypothetical protein
MTLKELCIELGISLWVNIHYGRGDGNSPMMGTHTCRLDPVRCSIVIDSMNNAAGVPYGLGFNETEATADLVRNLLECRQRDEHAPIRNAVIRYKSVYDNEIREFPIPADLTA